MLFLPTPLLFILRHLEVGGEWGGDSLLLHIFPCWNYLPGADVYFPLTTPCLPGELPAATYLLGRNLPLMIVLFPMPAFPTTCLQITLLHLLAFLPGGGQVGREWLLHVLSLLPSMPACHPSSPCLMGTGFCIYLPCLPALGVGMWVGCLLLLSMPAKHPPPLPACLTCPLPTQGGLGTFLGGVLPFPMFLPFLQTDSGSHAFHFPFPHPQTIAGGKQKQLGNWY